MQTMRDATRVDRVRALISALSEIVWSAQTSTRKLLVSAFASSCSFVARYFASDAGCSQIFFLGCVDIRVDVVAGAPQTGQVLGNRILLIFALTMGSSK